MVQMSGPYPQRSDLKFAAAISNRSSQEVERKADWRYLILQLMRLTANVLYVEDDADTRELVSLILERENYRVVLAENAAEALLLAQVMCFDLYLLDNWMPEGSGVELCKRLRQFDAKTPIIFYSGAAYESDKHEAFASGAQAYLTKPCDNDVLTVTIARVLTAVRKDEAPVRTVGPSIFTSVQEPSH